MNNLQFRPEYERWRHGGWLVTNVRYPGGACGCVARDNGGWRIVCATGEWADKRFPNRDAAALAEYRLANEKRLSVLLLETQ